jgi:NAD(P)-dependent dehydrogenase (short-subunit alcohol dehydrogenase family)
MNLPASAPGSSADASVGSSGDAGVYRQFEAGPEELRGRVIAVTGAGDGIGRAVALAAASHGAELVLIGRTVRKLEEVHAQIASLGKAEASIAPLDLDKAVARDYDQLSDALRTRYGRLDGLVHNAAILGTLTPIEHYEVPTWYRVLHVNLTAAFALTQVLLPALRASGDASIIFTSSGVARHPRAYWGAYAVSKAGVEALARLLAQELESAGTRVNVLNPGAVRTRMRAQAFPAENPQTLPTAGEIVRPYLWLLSGASRAVTGQSLDCQAAR